MWLDNTQHQSHGTVSLLSQDHSFCDGFFISHWVNRYLHLGKEAPQSRGDTTVPHTHMGYSQRTGIMYRNRDDTGVKPRHNSWIGATMCIMLNRTRPVWIYSPYALIIPSLPETLSSRNSSSSIPDHKGGTFRLASIYTEKHGRI